MRLDAQVNCDNHKRWKCQTSFDFGFIPLGDFISHSTTVQSNSMTLDPIDLYKIIKASGTNYCRITVSSELKVDMWAQELEGYWDTQLVDFLRYGFPLDFNRNSKLRCEAKNHNSTLQFPQDVDVYLEEELKFKAIVGPFEASPIDNLHCSTYGFSVVPTYFCPWTLNLHIAIVLLRLGVYYSVEIKRYKSQIRIRLL